MESLGKTPFSRRGFLAGVALAGVGGALGLSGCAPQEQTGQGETASTESAASSASDWLGSEPEIQEADVVETLDAEILIIGAGTGGLFAACAAGELGADTVVLEKFEGGVVRDDVGGVNSRLQQENGYSIDKQAFMRDMYRYAAGQCDLSLFDIWFENSGSVVDWYEEVLGQYGVTLWHEMAEEKNIPNYPHWATGHSPAWPQDGSLSGFSVLSDYAEKPVTLRFGITPPWSS